jgi:hypothetical protein
MRKPLLDMFFAAEAHLPEPIPPSVSVCRGKWLPVLIGFLSGMGEAATAVTIGRTIIVHRDARLTARILRHELEHVRQWQAKGVLFPLNYAWGNLRYGYDLNPYEVAARRAESSAAVGDSKNPSEPSP